MDLRRELDGGAWTDEKHLSYLGSLEASFVETLRPRRLRQPPLDRRLPDCAESTLDCKASRARKGGEARVRDSRPPAIDNASGDQVVPVVAADPIN